MSRSTRQSPPNRSKINRALGAVLYVLPLLMFAGCTDNPGDEAFVDLLSAVKSKDDDASNKQSGDESVEKPVPSKTGPWPEAVAEETLYNFGLMRVGTRQKHQFTIMNDGDTRLELQPGKPTCQCTQFSLDKNEIAPGELATLSVEWQAKKANTAFKHGGAVYTNDPEQPTLGFFVEGILEETVVTEPEATWDAGNVFHEEPITFEGLMYSRQIPELTIKSVEAKSEFITVDPVPMTEDELISRDKALCGWKLKITVQPGFPVGFLADTVTVATNELDKPIEIPVKARRVGDIRVSGLRGTLFSEATRTVHLGQFSAAKGRKAELMLIVDQNHFSEELQLLEVESDPPSLTASLEPLGKPTGVIARYKLTVEVPPGGFRHNRNTDDEAATVICRTNHPMEKEMLLRIEFRSF